jgi:hypothetical protein
MNDQSVAEFRDSDHKLIMYLVLEKEFLVVLNLGFSHSLSEQGNICGTF